MTIVFALAAGLMVCSAPTAVDGDNLKCNGINVRVRGVNARELGGTPCGAGHPCPDMPGAAAREVMVRLVAGGARVNILYQDRYGRPVADVTLTDGRDLACALIAEKAALRWERYWPREKHCE